jgi:hypothetical protein
VLVGLDQPLEHLRRGLEERLRLRCLLDLADVLSSVLGNVGEHVLELDRVVARVVLGKLMAVGHGVSSQRHIEM